MPPQGDTMPRMMTTTDCHGNPVIVDVDDPCDECGLDPCDCDPDLNPET